MRVMRSVAYFVMRLSEKTMVELQVQEIVTLDSTERSRLKVNLRQKSGTYGISRSALSAF